jgi:hypothetical protein
MVILNKKNDKPQELSFFKYAFSTTEVMGQLLLLSFQFEFQQVEAK